MNKIDILLLVLLFAVAGTARAQTTSSSSTTQSQFLGSVPSGKATPEVLPLSLREAVARGLKYNLGLLLTGEDARTAEGARWKELSNLLPNATTTTSEKISQVNLKAQGIRFPGVPTIVGPFGSFDSRANLTQTIFDFSAIEKTRAAKSNLLAARATYRDAREAVVQAVGDSYLQTIATAARVETAEAQRATAQALYDQALTRQTAGVSPAIDVLRAQVELKTREEQLIAARNDFAKQKLALGRVIGLPPGQEFTLTDKAPYDPAEKITVEEALARAYASRADYQSAQAQVRTAEQQRRAASAEYWPTFVASADYGLIGAQPTHVNGTVDAAASLKIPIFQGGRVHGDIVQADAALVESRERLENLRGQIDQDVRSALLDLQATAEQVEVARSNVDLANQTLEQARDRFAAGVTDNIEVVQAQGSVTSANEAYISSLYSYNVARISLARATGYAEKGVLEYWKGKSQ